MEVCISFPNLAACSKLTFHLHSYYPPHSTTYSPPCSPSASTATPSGRSTAFYPAIHPSARTSSINRCCHFATLLPFLCKLHATSPHSLFRHCRLHFSFCSFSSCTSPCVIHDSHLYFPSPSWTEERKYRSSEKSRSMGTRLAPPSRWRPISPHSRR